MSQRAILGFLGFTFLPYGLFCFLQPGFLEGAAGISATTTTGTTELRAMYGGLQAAMGALMLAGARDQGGRLATAALVAAAFVMPGLGLFRAAGAMMDSGVSSYTAVALVFELGSTAVLVPMLRRTLAA